MDNSQITGMNASNRKDEFPESKKSHFELSGNSLSNSWTGIRGTVRFSVR